MTGGGAPWGLERVYREAQTVVRPLITALIRTLEGMGAGASPDYARFEAHAREVLDGFAHAPASAPQFTSLRVRPTPAVRLDLIRGFMFSMGMDQMRVRVASQRILNASEAQLARPATGTGTGGRYRYHSTTPNSASMRADMRALYDGARSLRGRLIELRTTVGEPYAGRYVEPPRNPSNHRRGFGAPTAQTFRDRGVAQIVELLRIFPELASSIYRRAGLRGIENFPPRLRSGASHEAHELAELIEVRLEREESQEFISTIAIIVAGVALTAISAGTLGPVAGMLVGGGIAAAHGTAEVVTIQHHLTEAQDAVRVGGGSSERVAFLENELQGAWGRLLVDVVTAGALGRLGGASRLSELMQTARTVAISGGGSAIATATNPNVWNDPNTAGILLKAFVVGAATHVAGHAAGHRLASAGRRVLLGVSRRGGTLRVGSTVEIAAEGGTTTSRGRVVSISGDDIRIATPEGNIDFRVTAVATAHAR